MLISISGIYPQGTVHRERNFRGDDECGAGDDDNDDNGDNDDNDHVEQGTQTQPDWASHLTQAAAQPPQSPAPLEAAPPALATSTPTSLSKISEYGSCEELEMINGPGR